MKRSTQENNKEYLLGMFLVITGAIAFSAKAVMIKLAYGYGSHIDAISLMMLRMLMSLPFFIIIAAISSRNTKQSSLTFKEWRMIFILGIVGYYLASFFDFKGLIHISAGLERLILFLYPTFVVLLSSFLLKRPIRKIEVVALLLSYAGITFVVLDNISRDSENVIKGSLWIVASALAFAFFLIGSGEMTKRIGATRFTAYAMTISCIVTLFHYGLTHPLELPGYQREVYVLALMIAIISTVIPSFLMNAGIRRVGASPAAIMSSIGPVSTLILAYFFLNETINYTQIMGTFLVLLGVYLVGKSK